MKNISILDIFTFTFIQCLINDLKGKKLKRLGRNEIFLSKEVLSKMRDSIKAASISIENFCDQLNKLKNHTTLHEQIKNNYSEVYDGSMNFMNDLNKIKNQEKMKITKQNAINRIRGIINYALYLDWHTETGDKKAKEIADDFHKGEYGSRSGIFVQVDEAIEFIEYLLTNKEEMKITEETKVKDLIPEGYELDGNKAWKLDTDEEMCIPIKKKEVKDFNWYVKEYFNKIPHGLLPNNIGIKSDFIVGVYEVIPFEIKIGLLKFICDDINCSWMRIVDGSDKDMEPIMKICPKEFLNSIFE